MALKSHHQPVRIDIPDEPGQWLEIVPPSAGDMRDISGLEGYDNTLALMSKMLVAWSYPEPPTIENLTDLDTSTYSWLTTVILEHMGRRSDAEKKESDYSLTDGPALEMAASLASLAT